MVCCSATQDVWNIFVTLYIHFVYEILLCYTGKEIWNGLDLSEKEISFCGLCKNNLLSFMQNYFKKSRGVLTTSFKNYAMNLGSLVTFYEIKGKNLGKLPSASFQMKCVWFCSYWKSCEILSNFFLKINKIQQVILLVMKNDTGRTWFSQCSIPGHVLSLLSSLVFSPVASGEHPAGCTLRLLRQ